MKVSLIRLDPVLYSCRPLGAVSYAWLILADPAEVQTFSMRSKGLLVWNTLTQFAGAYVTWVDAIALNAIGMSRTY